MTYSDPPPYPIPVLSYDPNQPARPLWLARCICGLAMMNGLVSAGYVLPSRIPGSTFFHTWTDMPVVACGLLLAVFGGLGIFLVPVSRLGTVTSAIIMVLCNWLAQALNLRAAGPIDMPSVANAVVAVIDNATIPTFAVVCPLREPVKTCFVK